MRSFCAASTSLCFRARQCAAALSSARAASGIGNKTANKESQLRIVPRDACSDHASLSLRESGCNHVHLKSAVFVIGNSCPVLPQLMSSALALKPAMLIFQALAMADRTAIDLA